MEHTDRTKRQKGTPLWGAFAMSLLTIGGFVVTRMAQKSDAERDAPATTESPMMQRLMKMSDERLAASRAKTDGTVAQPQQREATAVAPSAPPNPGDAAAAAYWRNRLSAIRAGSDSAAAPPAGAN